MSALTGTGIFLTEPPYSCARPERRLADERAAPVERSPGAALAQQLPENHAQQRTPRGRVPQPAGKADAIESLRVPDHAQHLQRIAGGAAAAAETVTSHHDSRHEQRWPV